MCFDDNCFVTGSFYLLSSIGGFINLQMNVLVTPMVEQGIILVDSKNNPTLPVLLIDICIIFL